MQAKPCCQTMERQTSERVDLYALSYSPGDPPIKINNDVPSDTELCGVIGKLTNGRAVGASGMCAEHVKEWLHGVQWEEDPKGQGAEG